MGKQSRMKKAKYEPAPWTPFERMKFVTNPGAGTPDMDIPGYLPIYRNSRFQVQAAMMNAAPFGRIVWLSIKRIDREPMHDWRELQRIKNEIIGAEIEAVEIYPAESRVVDTSNQYHLWCFVDGFKLPFGYKNRVMIEHPERHPMAPNSRQRLWDADNRPKDVLEPLAIEQWRVKEWEQVADWMKEGTLYLKPDGGFRFEP